jgi:hypothetical protein
MHIFARCFYPLLFLFALLIFVDGAPALALAPAESVTTQEFWQRVDQTITTLRGLKSQPKETIAPALDTLADQWSQLDALTLPLGTSGKSTPLNASFLVSQLRKRPYDLNDLIDRFTDLQNAHSISATRTFGAADLAALQPILQSPDFQWDRPPSPLEELWNQIVTRFKKWMNDLFGQNEISIPVPSEAFTIGASFVLLLILLYVFRNLFSDFFMDASAKDEQMAGDELLTAESALQKAKDISKGGDYRTAVRYLYISSLLTLDERGLMRFDRSKTNREYLRSVAAFPQLSAPLRDVIDVFDRVWYGFQPLDEDHFQHYAEKVDQLREQKK